MPELSKTLQVLPCKPGYYICCVYVVDLQHINGCVFEQQTYYLGFMYSAVNESKGDVFCINLILFVKIHIHLYPLDCPNLFSETYFFSSR